MQIILITGTLSANDIPENVAVVVDDKKTEMAETKRGSWALTLPYQQDREFHLALILDFPAIGRKQYEQYMTQLLTTGDMSDITFVVKGHTFNAHKNIVSASPVLAAMFQGKNFIKVAPIQSKSTTSTAKSLSSCCTSFTREGLLFGEKIR